MRNDDKVQRGVIILPQTDQIGQLLNGWMLQREACKDEPRLDHLPDALRLDKTGQRVVGALNAFVAKDERQDRLLTLS